MLGDIAKESFRRIIAEKNPVVIFSHKNPDGDAIGSSLGLALFLQSLGIKVSVLIPNEVPAFLRWLPGFDLLHVYEENGIHCKKLIGEAGSLIFVDFNDPGRLDAMEECIKDAEAFKILIDHHQQPVSFADVIISEPWRGSAGEMIFQLIDELGLSDQLDKDIATCLYVAIMTDTGNFRYGSSYPEIFAITSRLLALGVEKDEIFSRVYDSYSVDRMKLMGYCMSKKLVVVNEVPVAYISLSRKELKEYNHKIGDTEGFVNIPFTIKGIKVTALFIEKKDHVKISLRSKGAFSVDQLARAHYNGGGHINAAGGESRLSLDDTLKQFEVIMKDFANEI